MAKTSAAYQRARYWDRYEAGRCVDCGHPKAEAEPIYCARCRTRANARQRGYAARNRLEAWTAPGPNVLACCGQWHSLTCLPFTCPQCTRVYFREEVAA